MAKSSSKTAARASRQTVKPARTLSPLAVAAIVVVLTVVAIVFTYQASYADRIYHGVSSGGVGLGGNTRAEASALLTDRYRHFASSPLVLRYQGREWRTLPEEIGARFAVDQTISDAIAVGRVGSLPQRLLEEAAAGIVGLPVDQPAVTIDQARRDGYLARVATEIDQPATDARLTVGAGGKLAIQPSRSGLHLNQELSARLIDDNLSALDSTPIELSVDELPPALAEAALAPVTELAQRIIGSPITLKLDPVLGGRSWTLERAQLQELLTVRDVAPTGGPRRLEVGLDEEALRKQLEEVAKQTAQPAKNARFDYAGGQLKAISPGADGKQLDVAGSLATIRDAANAPAAGRAVVLPVASVQAEIGPDDAAKLGIRDLIEQSSTAYDVGTSERRFNVELAASRVHGVVVPPGATFSFNDEVGEVSYRAGYKQGYGIAQTSDGGVQTIPSEGGGICQVATTLFHSVFWAGYPVVERNAHLYWIPRYGLPPKGLKGLDATIDQIYDNDGKLVSEIDLRFKNTTEDYLLIQARFDKKNLVFQFYGTKPKWVVKVEPPKIDKVVKADPVPIRQPDPKMAPGAEMMLEEARDGFVASIVRTVSRDANGDGKAEVVEQRNFVATYRPSHNVYVFGPKPTPAPTATPAASATPNPKTVGPAATPTPKPADQAATPTPKPAGPIATPTPKPAGPTASPTPKPGATPAKR